MSRNRIAIVNPDKCKPNKCQQECKKTCPVVRQGKLCIEVTRASKISSISEELCIGCGMCAKKCPFQAIRILNLPKPLQKTTHRYGANTFSLHGLPVPRRGQVLGLVGTNGIGKTTALKVLKGALIPNLGNFQNPPKLKEILDNFKGSDMQAYFKKLSEGKLRSAIKPQYVDSIPKFEEGKIGQLIVGHFLDQNDKRGVKIELCEALELTHLLDRKIGELSGGELQRFAIALTAMKDVDIYMFDEPSSYLDVKQRLKAAKVIRSLLKEDKYVIVVEHDLSVLDYMSDFVCCLYGEPGAYGVVTLPFSVRDGINIFLSGEIPTENLRFRGESLVFRASEVLESSETYAQYRYPSMVKRQGNFKLKVMGGEFTDSQIIVMLGENGTGKTTFIKMLAGKLSPNEAGGEIPRFSVSYKKQTNISPRFEGSVGSFLHKTMPEKYKDPQFSSDVIVGNWRENL